MTAPTQRDEHDDDSTVPVSELLAHHGNPFRDIPKQAEPEPDTAPLRIDVSIAIFAAVWLGVVAAQIAEAAPNSYLIVWLGAIVVAQLLIKWTRKR